jgi:hypothetical protein
MTPSLSTPAYAMEMAIHANLAALALQLENAQLMATCAKEAMEAQNRNLALGTMLPLERILPQCETLLRAALALQSWRNQLPQEGGAA